MDTAINDLITNQLIISLVGFLVTTIGGLVSGFLIGRFKKHKKEVLKKQEEELKRLKEREEIERACVTILKASARRLIFNAYEDYIIEKKHLTIDRFREITETFEAYTVCGGNGTAKKYYQEISKLNPYLVTD